MNDIKKLLNGVTYLDDHTEASQLLNTDNIFLFKFGIYTARQLCGITPSVRPFSSQLVKIPPPPPPPTSTPRSQNFTIQRRFCPAPIRSFLRIAKFPTCSKTLCVAFVSKTFSCKLFFDFPDVFPVAFSTKACIYPVGGRHGRTEG